jgi:hypothetical protein
MKNNETVSEDLGKFLRNYAEDVFSMRVFLYFTDHPYAQLSETVIMSAVGRGVDKHNIQKALSDFVGKGIIGKSVSHDVSFYSLPDNIRNLAIEMDNMGQVQRYSLMNEYSVYSSLRRGSVLRTILPAMG